MTYLSEYLRSPVIIASLTLVMALGIGGVMASDMQTPLTDSPSEASIDSNPVEYKGVMTVKHERLNEDGEYETVNTYRDENLIVDQGLDFFQCQSAGNNQVRWYDEAGASDAGYTWSNGIQTKYSGETYEKRLFVTDEDANCPTASTAGVAQQTDNAYYISLSGEDQAPTATLEQNPHEITSGGLERVRGTVTDVGTGHYSLEFTFVAEQDFDSATITGSDNIQMTGLHWSSNQGDDDLVAANQFPGVTMLQDDRLTIAWEEVSFSTGA